MEFTTIFWVVLIVMIIITAVAAMEFARIAEMKGHSGTKYFWWCFLVALYGIPMVIALPDRGNAAAEAQAQSDELPDL